ncbi:MAG: GAF domain-containing protein, partial [Desulfobacterales bacterium]
MVSRSNLDKAVAETDGVQTLKSQPGEGVQDLKSQPGKGVQDLTSVPGGGGDAQHLKTHVNGTPASAGVGDQQVVLLENEVEHIKQLQELGNKIYAATNLNEILTQLRDEITGLFQADRMTVYMVDGVKRELISHHKSGNEVKEIRIPISANSIAGHAALKQRMLNIANVYDGNELKSVDPDLKFDRNWDVRTNYRTRSVLVHPIIFEKFLLGAIQLINKAGNRAFTLQDEGLIQELAKILGIALFNQKRMAKATKTHKFDYLLENHLLTQKELNQAIAEARKQKDPIESFLIKRIKIPKKDVGKSLSKYYGVPFVEYNPKASIPGELILGIKVPFMRNNRWVPLRIEEGKIIIAVDNPNDLQKIDEIKALFPGKPLVFHVALPQDILDYIA